MKSKVAAFIQTHRLIDESQPMKQRKQSDACVNLAESQQKKTALGIEASSDEIGIEKSQHVLVALSGGPDSVALLLVLHELHYRLTALHCNFHLRGEESNRDEAFVRSLCQRMEIPLRVKHFDTQRYAAEHKISIEMAARDLRYYWFNEILEEINAQAIAVAHHRDDLVETMLLNLIRGTGIRGLCGMPVRNGNIVRPLLCVTRKEILDYLAAHRQTYVTDSSNEERIALRNIIRLDLLPMLRNLNPRIDEKLTDTADYLRMALDATTFQTERWFREYGITPERFTLPLPLPPEASWLLHEWISEKGFNSAQERQMLDSLPQASSRRWLSSTHRIAKRAHTLTIYSNTASEAPILRQDIVTAPHRWEQGCAYFDADLLSQPLTVRPVTRGDRMQPFGMKGTKLLSDLMREMGLDLEQRRKQFVVCHGSEILWLMGHRSSNLYKVTEQTKRILRLSIEQGPKDETTEQT